MITKKRFAAEIEDGEVFDDVFLLESIQKKTKRRGGDYWVVTLRDRTGSITGKLWERPPGELPRPGGFVKVRCEASLYNDEVELNVKLIRTLATEVETVNIEDFVPVGTRDRFQQVHELDKCISLIRHDGLRAACGQIFEDRDLYAAFRDAPAAKTNHHAYVGGLLDHVLALCNLARELMKAYRYGGRWPADEGLAEDLLVAAAIWHDIGKTKELAWSTSIAYTSEGQMIGHVAIGLQMLEEARAAFWLGVAAGAAVRGQEPGAMERDERIWLHLRHIVASHHGRLEWGAAKVPMSREAAVFHMLDMIDSRMGAFDQLDLEQVDGDGFGGWAKMIDGPFWRMP